MTEIEQLEKQKAELEAKRKEIKKAISAERRKERAKAEAEARAMEQAEALEFLRFCKSKTVSDNGREITLYDYVRGLMNSQN